MLAVRYLVDFSQLYPVVDSGTAGKESRGDIMVSDR
jgi:hypothetical protein